MQPTKQIPFSSTCKKSYQPKWSSCVFLRHVSQQVGQQSWLPQHAHSRPPVVTLQHRGVLHRTRTGWNINPVQTQPHIDTHQDVCMYLVEGRQVVSSLDEKRLVDSGVIDVVSGCSRQTQEHIQRSQLLGQLQCTKIHRAQLGPLHELELKPCC